MSQEIAIAVFNTLADMLERIQTGISEQFKLAEEDSAAEGIFSKLDDILGKEIENLRDAADTADTEDDE